MRVPPGSSWFTATPVSYRLVHNAHRLKLGGESIRKAESLTGTKAGSPNELRAASEVTMKPSAFTTNFTTSSPWRVPRRVSACS
jgi:hypothetical protein